MNLAQFRDFLAQHGVKLVLTPDGKIKPTAGQPPAAEVVEQIRAGVLSHRAQLLAELGGPLTTSAAELVQESGTYSPHAVHLGEDSSTYSPSSGPKVATFAINPPTKPNTHTPDELKTVYAEPTKPDTAPPVAGTCATCPHWVALEGWGYQMGKCGAPLRYFAPGNGPGLAISGAHTCPSVGGQAWQVAAPTPKKLEMQQTQAVGLGSTPAVKRT